MNVLIKDFYRTIFGNFTKFLSILLLTALGVMVFVGLRITSPIMKSSVEEKINRGKLYDFKIDSTFGFLKEDIEIIEFIKNEFQTELGFSINVTDKNKEIEFRVENEPVEIGKVNIIKGQNIENEGEILLDKRLINTYKIGDTLTFDNFEKTPIFDGEVKKLNRKDFVVVGFIESAEIGVKDLHEGSESGYYAVINISDFNFTNYSFVKVINNELHDLKLNSKEYIEKKQNARERLNVLFKNRPIEVYSIVYNQRKVKIDDSKKDITDKKNDLKNSEIEIEKSINKLQNGQSDVRTAYINLNNQKKLFIEEVIKSEEKINLGLEELKSKKFEIKGNLEKLKNGKNLLTNGISEIEKELLKNNTLLEEVGKAISELDLKLGKNEITKEVYDVEKAKLDVQKIALEEGISKISEQLTQKNKELEELNQQLSNLDNANIEINTKEKELFDSKTKLEEERIKGLEKFDQYYYEISQMEDRIRRGEIEIEGNKEKIEEGKKKISEGEEKIEEADELISKLLDPQYIITDGLINSSSSVVLKSGDGIVGLSNIFSVFFFFIAILVSLTAMTRMVDENRIQIGTLKALGYSNFTISKKYFYYGFWASFLGGILGAVLGVKIISPLVYNAYLSPFDFEKVDNFQYVGTLIVGVMISVVTTSMSAYLACNKSLKEKISLLMRAKIPKAGNKIFLEKLKFVWKEFSFLLKVTIRNIFRYKIRLIMTVLGIAGCMGLLVLGFGIKDSISGVTNNQYSKYTKYHITVNYNPIDLEKNLAEFDKTLREDSRIKDVYDLTILRGEIKTDIDMENTVSIFTIDNIDKFNKFFTLYENDKIIEKLEDGLYINEKLSERLKLKVGDKISFYENNDLHTYKIAGVFENHLGNSIAMSDKVHQKIFSKRQVKNSKLIIAKNDNENEIKALAKDLKKQSPVVNVIDVTSSKEILNNLLASVNMIVLVIIVCSAFLSIVVLYNLSNINISERKREIATLKVLGFYPKEVSAYVYRETLILTIFGIVLGIITGNILHRNIMMELASDTVQFFSTISLYSYIYSALLTVFFVFVVYFVVKLILRKVNMIESLKDVE